MRQIKAEHFVKLWLEAYEHGDGIVWIAERINRPTSTVSGMASTLRKEGIKLPTLRRRHIEAFKITHKVDFRVHHKDGGNYIQSYPRRKITLTYKIT